MHKKKTKLEIKLTKSNRGGKRINSGRKKVNYETKTLVFRVREEFVEPIKKMVNDYVSERLQGDAKPLLCAVKFQTKMFKVGQKVVCIRATQSGSVKEGEIYTVKAVGFNHEDWVRLEESNPSQGYANFSAWRFREIDINGNFSKPMLCAVRKIIFNKKHRKWKNN